LTGHCSSRVAGARSEGAFFYHSFPRFASVRPFP
jgi:hypothetical protein